MNSYPVLERLAFHNPWWEKGKVPPHFLPEFKRPMVSTLFSYLKNERAVLLKGPRRVGKTTVFYHVIDALLKNKINPKDICYLSFDDPMLKLPLDELMKTYEKFRGERLTKGKTYFFLDEAQFLKDWELTVKLYIDRKLPVKFFVSGSSVSLLTQRTESLAGRTLEETLFPFSFMEFLAFFSPSLFKNILAVRKTLFPASFPTRLAPFSGEIRLQFQKFLCLGGFPHLYREKEEWRMRLIKEDIVDKVIFRDLVELYKIREPSIMEKLFYFMGRNTACLINLTSLSQLLGISRVAVEQYLSYLERSLLFYRLPKFSASLKESLRSNPKGHVMDTALARFFGAADDMILETAVSSFLFTAEFHAAERKVFFWRDQFHEVDVVLQYRDKALAAVEVKNSQRREIPKSLLYFMEKYRLKRGTVIYQGEFEKVRAKGMEIIFCPAWYFFLFGANE